MTPLPKDPMALKDRIIGAWCADLLDGFGRVNAIREIQRADTHNKGREGEYPKTLPEIR